MTRQEELEEEELNHVVDSLIQQEKDAVAHWTRKINTIRAGIQQSKAVYQRYMDRKGAQGIASLSRSILSLCDEATLKLLDAKSGLENIPIFIGAQTLAGADRANPDFEHGELDDLLIKNVYYSQRINLHPDSPVDQTPAFPLSPNYATGLVAVGDKSESIE